MEWKRPIKNLKRITIRLRTLTMPLTSESLLSQIETTWRIASLSAPSSLLLACTLASTGTGVRADTGIQRW